MWLTLCSYGIFIESGINKYEAYINDRAVKDPSDIWFDGEKRFFDFYIIPLAKKLKDCGVFVVSLGEYLQNAVQNRKEWELIGNQWSKEKDKWAYLPIKVTARKKNYY